MSKRKYAFTGEIKVHEGRKLRRIRALRRVGNRVDEGDLGGWIEHARNLSHYGSCWIEDDAMAYENAQVIDDAVMTHNSQLFGFAVLKDRAKMFNESKAAGSAVICDAANLWMDAYVGGACRIQGNARVTGSSEVLGNVLISDCVLVDGNSRIRGRVRIEGRTRVNSAFIESLDHFVTFNNVGSEGGTLTVFRANYDPIKGKPIFHCTRGCFVGTTAEFIQASLNDHSKKNPEIHREYKKLIEVAISRLNRSIKDEF